jgi:hypothetical protein
MRKFKMRVEGEIEIVIIADPNLKLSTLRLKL